MLKNSPWWLSLVQGLVAVGAGVYLLVAPARASLLIGVLAALYLLISGVIHLFRGLRVRRRTRGSFSLIRGIVGIVIGGAILLLAVFNIGSLSFGYTILAIGLLIFGALGLFGSFFKREGKSFAWGPVIVNAALLIWGLIILFARSTVNLPAVSGWILVIIGVVIILYTVLGRRDPESEAA